MYNNNILFIYNHEKPQRNHFSIFDITKYLDMRYVNLPFRFSRF